LQAYSQGADWLRKKKNISGTVTTPAHITTQSRTFKCEVVRGVTGHTPQRKFGFLRSTCVTS